MKLDVKRFYLPIELRLDCPDCKHEWVVVPNKEYISYPDTNKKNMLYFICPECDAELEMDIDLRVSIIPQYCSIKKQS